MNTNGLATAIIGFCIAAIAFFVVQMGGGCGHPAGFKTELKLTADERIKYDALIGKLRALGAEVGLGTPHRFSGPVGTCVTLGHDPVTPALIELIREIPGPVLLVFDQAEVPDFVLQKLRGMPNLEVLYLWEPTMDPEELAHVAAFRGLTHLELTRIPVQDEQLRFLQALKGLRSLDLYATSAGDRSMSYLAAMRDLEVLDLGATKITDRGLALLKNLSKLRVLILDDTGVTGDGLSKLDLRNLEHLVLDETDISDAALQCLRSSRKLISVCVNGTNVTNECLPELGKLQDLGWFEADRTKVTLEAARSALPHRCIISAVRAGGQARRD